MSHFPTAHLITKFVAGSSQALTGQRLAKIGYKSSPKSPAKFPSVCVSVPVLDRDDILGNIETLIPHVRNMLCAAQDGIVRSLYESSQGTLSQVNDSEIGVQECISFLNAEASGGRLTKEIIEAWFSASVFDYLFVIIGEKLRYDMESEISLEQEATIKKHVNGYRGLFESLAGGKTILQPNQITSLGKVLDLIDDSEIGDKLKSRLAQMSKKEKIEDLLEL